MLVDLESAAGTRLVIGDVALGLVAAWGGTQVLAGTLQGIQPHAAPASTAVPLRSPLLGCPVLDRWATSIDPLVALRTE